MNWALVLAFLASACAALAGGTNVSLAWDRSPDDTGTNGTTYVLYSGTTGVARAYQASTNVGAVSNVTVAGRLGETRYAVTAVSREGLESEHSNELIVVITRPRSPKISGYSVSLMK